MEKHNELQALFDAARTEKPAHTFEETKDQFLRSVESHVQTNATKKISLIKKLISMLVPVSIVSIVISVFYFQEKNTVDTQSPQIVLTEPISEEFPDTLYVASSEKTSFHERKISTASSSLSDLKPKAANNPESNHEVFKSLKTRGPVEGKQSETGQPVPKIHLEADFPFPRLTVKEIAANHKQKNAMLKALEKMDKRTYVFIPSGMIQLDDKSVSLHAFYMQRTEITNLEYRTFLFDLLIQGRKEEFLLAKPNQSKWTELTGEMNKAMEETYFSHDVFNNYPVVNISRKGAEMYCNWLSQELQKRIGGNSINPTRTVRIPTRAEWVFAASASGENLPYPWKGDAILNEKNCYLANHKPTDSTYSDDGASFTAAVNSYLPNSFGLFNMSGNVAEMVWNDLQTKTAGTAGGGWMDEAESLKIHAVDPYSGISEAHPNIGFRVVISHLGHHNKIE
jgi:formylglycine-generating enzyme required for sulfatase activity